MVLVIVYCWLLPWNRNSSGEFRIVVVIVVIARWNHLSIFYRSTFNLLSIYYQSTINLLSFYFQSSIILLSFFYKNLWHLKCASPVGILFDSWIAKILILLRDFLVVGVPGYYLILQYFQSMIFLRVEFFVRTCTVPTLFHCCGILVFAKKFSCFSFKKSRYYPIYSIFFLVPEGYLQKIVEF